MFSIPYTISAIHSGLAKPTVKRARKTSSVSFDAASCPQSLVQLIDLGCHCVQHLLGWSQLSFWSNTGVL